MRTKLVIAILLVLIAVAAMAAWWHYSRITPIEEVAAPGEVPVEDDGVRPEITWGEGESPTLDASPEGLYNDLRSASEDAHRKPSLEIERVPPPALPPPTRGEDDDPD